MYPLCVYFLKSQNIRDWNIQAELAISRKEHLDQHLARVPDRTERIRNSSRRERRILFFTGIYLLRVELYSITKWSNEYAEYKIRIYI